MVLRHAKPGAIKHAEIGHRDDAAHGRGPLIELARAAVVLLLAGHPTGLILEAGDIRILAHGFVAGCQRRGHIDATGGDAGDAVRTLRVARVGGEPIAIVDKLGAQGIRRRRQPRVQGRFRLGSFGSAGPGGLGAAPAPLSSSIRARAKPA